MLWEVEISPAKGQIDAEGLRVVAESKALAAGSIESIKTARSFLIQTESGRDSVEKAAEQLLSDPIVESYTLKQSAETGDSGSNPAQGRLLNVLLKPGVTDNVGNSTRSALEEMGLSIEAVATCRKYWFAESADEGEMNLVADKLLYNDAIEHVIHGPLELDSISLGGEYNFELTTVPISTMDDAALQELSKTGQLYLDLTEMQTIKAHFVEMDRDPTDIELETVAQTWSEHCSHKTLAGRIHYVETTDGKPSDERRYENMLKETIFQATVSIRERLGDEDWCVSVFKDNAGIVTFDETQNVCFKVETHNHPSALEPYGGANTGIGGVIRDPLGTGMGARPVCNTDVFCFAPPETSYDSLPPGVLHPKVVATGVVSGVRDYGNRMGIPTVNGAVFFDERYIGNPLVYCGNVAMIPVDKCGKHMKPGDLIVAVGGRTGRDGIHGATFSSAELTEESESLSGGAVQIGNAITEKMVADVLLQARDLDLYSSITDCGAGGFSSAVGEMGEESGAEVWLEKCPLKYSGLSYTEIWISEAQERMVLAVPPEKWEAFNAVCAAEGVEATAIGKFTDDHRLVLKYHDQVVGDVAMSFLHDGRPPVVRSATYDVQTQADVSIPAKDDYSGDLKAILGSLNVASKEWIIRQYDHEVQSGSVVKPLVGVCNDGPSDAAVVRPDLNSNRGLVISNGMNPCFGDYDPYWMAASAIDEAMRNAVAVGADPNRIAILDNFCWGNTERAETLGTLVRAAIACQDMAEIFVTPFISGKDSLNNEFSYVDTDGERQQVTIPSSLLISALGQIDNVEQSVTMDLKEAGNRLLLVGETKNELGGSHITKVNDINGGQVPKVDAHKALAIFKAMHKANTSELIASCHDLSEGGLAVAAAEMSFAGELGVDLTLPANESLTDAVQLFSESNTRFLVEIAPSNVQKFTETLGAGNVTDLGEVNSTDRVVIQGSNGTSLIDSPFGELKESWQKPINWG